MTDPTYDMTEKRTDAFLKDVKVATVRIMTGASLGRKLNHKDWVIMAKLEPCLKTMSPTGSTHHAGIGGDIQGVVHSRPTTS